MERRYIVRMHWPDEGRRGRPTVGHTYLYLALAETEAEAIEMVEARWRGKTGGANPHVTEIEGEVNDDLFQLIRLPEGM